MKTLLAVLALAGLACEEPEHYLKRTQEVRMYEDRTEVYTTEESKRTMKKEKEEVEEFDAIYKTRI